MEINLKIDIQRGGSIAQIFKLSEDDINKLCEKLAKLTLSEVQRGVIAVQQRVYDLLIDTEFDNDNQKLAAVCTWLFSLGQVHAVKMLMGDA